MSADEFDPAIERLFARQTPMLDAELFAAQVETRLTRSSRVRAFALTLAGIVGGCVAVRESVNLNFSGAETDTTALTQGVQASGVTAQGAVQSGLDSLGLSSIDLMSTGGMQMFWITAGALFALLAAGAVRLSQDL